MWVTGLSLSLPEEKGAPVPGHKPDAVVERRRSCAGGTSNSWQGTLSLAFGPINAELCTQHEVEFRHLVISKFSLLVRED